ncbi:TP53-regulating kinase [Orchesella cincta]|uniref:non-specific serine/threonine protein kinase n=1 Tax=Orchesella cincta TaxID=48709 RepID=A0A1D2NC88_ORCCI|nr:TP53-regulating kinase [Orchesella cincta]
MPIYISPLFQFNLHTARYVVEFIGSLILIGLDTKTCLVSFRSLQNVFRVVGYSEMEVNTNHGASVTVDKQLFKQGAEARLFTGSFFGRKTIIKERFSKKYRHPELDERLTKERMRAELKGLMRCKNIGIWTPAVYFVESKSNCVHMELLENVDTVNIYIGKLLAGCKDGSCDVQCTTKLKQLGEEVGITVGKMHAAGIIHGDLTTSNILIDSTNVGNDGSKPRLALIDFGLSHVDNSPEDKGVDLYVLERALTSTFSNIPWFFDIILASYKGTYSTGGEEVFKKLEEIRLRGRKRTMVG